MGDIMKDQDIRSILIEYLMAEGSNLRIYQEKSIGSSICDVMAVSTRFTEYMLPCVIECYRVRKIGIFQNPPRRLAEKFSLRLMYALVYKRLFFISLIISLMEFFHISV